MVTIELTEERKKELEAIYQSFLNDENNLENERDFDASWIELLYPFF